MLLILFVTFEMWIVASNADMKDGHQMQIWMPWMSSLFKEKSADITWVDAKKTAIFYQCNVLKWTGENISHHNCNGCKDTCYLGDKITKKVGNPLETKIATWICKEISEHIKLSKLRLS